MKNDKNHSEWLSIIDLVTHDPVLYALLKYCPLEILRHWQLKQFTQGSLICYQGEICNDFHLIVQGDVDIFTLSEDDRKYSQARYHKGDMLGELEIFEQRPYICSVEAISEVTLLTLKRDYFCRWLTLDNYFNQKILQLFSRQYYQLSKKAGEDTLYSLHQRVCLALWQKFQNAGFDCNKLIYINKSEMSDQFAVVPRSINRVLFELREKNIIVVHGEEVQVIDPLRLQQQAEHNC